jgi:hypothetical protein
MNCKPGDLAVSIGSKNPGRFMRVLYAAPYHEFTLPNGRGAMAATEPSWVVELLDGTMMVDLMDGSKVAVRFGAARDRCIKPIRDPDEEMELCTESEMQS